jgi:hypothetical protein
MLDPRISTRLKDLVLNLDRAGVEKATREALEAGDSPQDIVSEGLSRGMEEVGETSTTSERTYWPQSLRVKGSRSLIWVRTYRRKILSARLRRFRHRSSVSQP